jgi:hypothetical protein
VGVGRVWLLCALLVMSGSLSIRAQDSVSAVEVDAIECWRRVGANAVHVGEQFDMQVTCSIVETDEARAVVDVSWLDPETLGVSPFEVIDGERYQDLVQGPRRFFQYRYSLRLIGEDYFGLDVELPPLELRYRIERTLPTGVVAEGRELTYLLPAESVRVLSLVPTNASDIRELPTDTFGDAEARLFRASVVNIAGMVFGAFALIAFGAAVLVAHREWKGRVDTGVPCASDWGIARATLDHITSVQRERQTNDWTPALVARGLAAFRVAGALAVSLPVAQREATPNEQESGCEGEVLVSRSLFSSTRLRVSSPLTVKRLNQELAASHANIALDGDMVALVRDGLGMFSVARYGAESLDAEALDRELVLGISVMKTLVARHFPIRRMLERYWNDVRALVRLR